MRIMYDKTGGVKMRPKVQGLGGGGDGGTVCHKPLAISETVWPEENSSMIKTTIRRLTESV